MGPIKTTCVRLTSSLFDHSKNFKFECLGDFGQGIIRMKLERLLLS